MSRQDLAKVRDDLIRLQPEFANVLGGIKPERFVRVTMTAIQRNPDLLDCSRRSLFLAVQQCAQDGLLPDGKEAVLLPFKTKDGSIVSYIPMIAGLRRKLRESAEIADINVELVRDGDVFEYTLGDEPRIVHRPSFEGIQKAPTYVYSIIRFRDGTISRNVMPWAEVMMIRDRYARSRSGPWFDPAAIGEMAKKTCLKRHLKLQPMAPELEQLIDRDNEAFYDVSPSEQVQQATKPLLPQRDVTAVLDTFASDPDTGEIPETNESWFETAKLKLTTKEAYIDFIKNHILRTETKADVIALSQFWNTTEDERHRLGFTNEEERVLHRHITALQSVYYEEEDETPKDDMGGVQGIAES